MCRSPPAPLPNGGRQPYREWLSPVIWAESWGAAVGAASFATGLGSAGWVRCGWWVCRRLFNFFYRLGFLTLLGAPTPGLFAPAQIGFQGRGEPLGPGFP